MDDMADALKRRPLAPKKAKFTSSEKLMIGGLVVALGAVLVGAIFFDFWQAVGIGAAGGAVFGAVIFFDGKKPGVSTGKESEGEEILGLALLGAVATAVVFFFVSLFSVAPSTGEPIATIACRHYEGFAANSHLKTDTELRGELKVLLDRAKGSKVRGIEAGAEGMLAAITSGDRAAYVRANDQFVNGCKSIGWE